MKSYLEEKKSPQFPCLMESKEVPGRIVLFTKKDCGVLLHEGEINSYVIHYDENWNIQNFKPYSGTVTLEN